MKREEAIKWVKFVHDVLYEDKDEDIRTALNMAIEALHREEAEEKGYCHRINFIPKPCADTESKVDPIVIRPTVYFGKSDFDKWAAEVKKESDRIIVIPHDAEVVVNTVTGRWVEEIGDWYGGGAYVCSICGYGYSFGAYHEANEFRYCPNCGARMEVNE